MAESGKLPGRVTLTAPAELETIELVHTRLEELCAEDDTVSVADRVRFETAVVEILGNIIEHAFRLDATHEGERLLEVVLEITPERLTAALADNGRPAEVDLSEVTMPGADAESGRGLALALATLDDLGYERRDGRNHWTLVCERSSG